MSLPPVIYATLGGPIDQETLPRIFLNLNGATAGGANTVHLLFQSTGGMVGDGIALYNYFQTFPVDLHIYNGGMVASIGVLAYLGASHRYASAHSSFMIHRTRMTVQGPQTATQMRAATRSLELDDTRTEAILKTHTKIPSDRWQMLDIQDVYFTAADAVQFGIAEAIREFQIPTGERVWNV
jgi:ATP-dependent Clp protease, protease subunit